MSSGPHPSAVVDELSNHPEVESLAAYVRAVALAAARARKRGFASTGEALPDVDVAPPARDAAATPLGNLLEVLEQGTHSPEQRALLGALLALGIAGELPSTPEAELELAALLVWLAAHTPVNALASADAALGDKADALWAAVARIVDSPAAAGADFDVAESLVAAVALGASKSPQAQTAARDLAEQSGNPLLRAVLGAPRGEGGTRLGGELSPAPYGPLVTALLAVTGILLVLGIARLIGRFALAYRRPARVAVTSRGLELSHRTEMLGRVLRDRQTLVPLSNLARVTREVRFARAGLYAGLLALVLGSYFGMGLFVDGLRVPGGSFPLLGLAVLVIVVGLVVDFALSSVADSARGRCRVVVVPRKGRKLCIGELDPARADAMLEALAARSIAS